MVGCTCNPSPLDHRPGRSGRAIAQACYHVLHPLLPSCSRRTYKGYEEVKVPAAPRAPPPAEGELVAIDSLEDWAQLAFQGYKTLNRIQVGGCALDGSGNGVVGCGAGGSVLIGGAVRTASLCYLDDGWPADLADRPTSAVHGSSLPCSPFRCATHCHPA